MAALLETVSVRLSEGCSSSTPPPLPGCPIVPCHNRGCREGPHRPFRGCSLALGHGGGFSPRPRP